MSFTDRFVTVPIIQYDHSKADMTGKEYPDVDWVESYKRINPLRIQSYEPTVPKGKELTQENFIWVSIVMEGGDEFYITENISQFEKRLNEHQK